MENITHNIRAIKETLPSDVKLIAVSKFHPVEAIAVCYEAGQRIFGESKVQELAQKCTLLPADIQWHFIGHLQTNKVKQLLPMVDTIHSVDSWKLFNEIEKQATAIKKKVRCLLEIRIADEDTKFGLSLEECRKFLTENPWRDCKYAYIGGIMGMATNTDDEYQIKNEFRSLKGFFEELKTTFFADDSSFADISMGMSSDYKIAVEEGSTMVRIGSSIFGDRIYINHLKS